MDVKAFNDANEDLKKELNEFRERSKKVFIAGVYRIHKDIISLWFSVPKYNLIGLSRRDGKAASSWHVIVNRGSENITANIVSSGAPYVGAFFEDREIKPKQKKWLAIPAGAGVIGGDKVKARYPGGPLQAERELSKPEGVKSALQFVKKDSDTAFFFARKGVKGTGITDKKRLLFVLKKKVNQKARLKPMLPWVDKQASKLMREMDL